MMKVKGLIISILFLLTLSSAELIKIDLGGNISTETQTLSDVITIFPTFGAYTPFYRWSHMYTKVDKDYGKYQHAFGVIHNKTNKHVYKFQNSYDSYNSEFVTMATYEHLNTFQKQKEDTSKVDVTYFSIGEEVGPVYSFIKNESTPLGLIGVNFNWIRLRGIKKDGTIQQYSPITSIFQFRSNFSDRPFEFFTKIRVEPVSRIYAELKYDFRIKDRNLSRNYDLTFGITSSL